MNDADKSALPQGYAWNWFALHSGQRLQLVNFWLVAVAFLAAAFVQARSSHQVAIAFGVALTGAVSSLAFMRLDVRTRQLVHVAEEALISLEKAQTAAGVNEAFELVAASRRVRTRPFDSYRIIIEGLQLTVAVIFLIAAIYSVS